MMERPVSPTQPLLDAIRAVLESIGTVRPASPGPRRQSALDLLYEDEHSVVGVSAFETVQDLIASWLDAQDDLSRIMSAVIPSMNSKAWDGYLIAVTGQVPRSTEAADLAAIRSNTRRARKLVITGDDVGHGSAGIRNGIRRGLAPLLPLELPEETSGADPIAGLPSRISVPGMTAADVAAVIAAYEDGLPPLQALHQRMALGGAG